MKKVLIAVAILVMAVFLGSCAKVPQAELDATNAAITKAKTAGADVYLAPAFNSVMDSLNAINAEIETNKGKLFKNFSDVKVKLAALESNANDLASKAEAKKEAIKEEVNTTLSKLKTVSEENATLVKKAPRGKEGKAAIESIESDMNTINASVEEISQMLKNGDLLNAQTKVNATYTQAMSINQELKTAIEKYTSKQHRRPVVHRRPVMHHPKKK